MRRPSLDPNSIMSWQILFTIFFITLGPVKLVVPFATLTQNASPSLSREIALRSFGISLMTTIVMFFFGRYFLTKFNVGVESVRLTAGLILLIWSLAVLRQPVDPAKAPEPPLTPNKNFALIPLTLPHTLTPQGIAAVVLLSYLVVDQGVYPVFQVLAMLTIIMLLNLITMFAASRLLRWLGGPALLQVLGSILAVLQAVLGVHVFVNGLRGLGVITG
jgi:small neutral amino acid transporter SnatA (MarC family)